MGLKDVRRVRAMRRIWESVIATVTGGLILWSMTSSLSQPDAANGRTPVTVVPVVQPTATPPNPSLLTSTIVEAPPPRLGTTLSIRHPLWNQRSPCHLRESIRFPTRFLLEESCCTKTFHITGGPQQTGDQIPSSKRVWIIATGLFPMSMGRIPSVTEYGCPASFPLNAGTPLILPEVTRGVLGWWKEPVSTKISFLNDQGAKYSIGWAIRYGNDPTRLNPLGSSSLYAKKHYHAFKLPDGTTNEIAVTQPTGLLRIQRENNTLKVFLDDQPAVVGTLSAMGQLDGFEIEVVRATNGTLFFTDFKIAR